MYLNICPSSRMMLKVDNNPLGTSRGGREVCGWIIKRIIRLVQCSFDGFDDYLSRMYQIVLVSTRYP